MTGLLDVQTPRSPQGLKGEVSLIFSERDREIEEDIREGLMRSGFTVTEKPEGGEAGHQQAGTVLYLASADTPKSIASTMPEAAPTGVHRQLSIWRALFATAAIGLIAFIGVSGALYQQNQSVNRDFQTAIEQRDTAIADRQQMNDRLYESNITTDKAQAARDRAIADRQQMNDELYIANVAINKAQAARDRALIERQQMNDKLYVANVTAERAQAARDRAVAERQQINNKLYVANIMAERATEGERVARNRVEELQKELDKSNQQIEELQGALNNSNQRINVLEELLRNRPIQSSQPSP